MTFLEGAKGDEELKEVAEEVLSDSPARGSNPKPRQDKDAEKEERNSTRIFQQSQPCNLPL